jgi:uncharacterized protein
MVPLSFIAGFEWDRHNGRKSVEKHTVGQSEAEQVFFNEPLLLAPDTLHSHAEERYNAVGQTDHGRVLHVTFTLRGGGTLIRVISARDASRKERKLYVEA